MKNYFKFVLLSILLSFLVIPNTAVVEAVGQTTVSNVVIKAEGNTNSHRESIEFDYQSVNQQVGDAFRVEIAAPLSFVSVKPFPLLTSDGVIVGTCTPQKMEMECVFNENVQPVMKGHIQVWSKFYVEPTKESRVIPVEISIAGNVSKHDISVVGTGVIQDPLVKFANLNNGMIDYSVQLNITKKSYTQAMYTDLPDENSKVDLQTVKVYKAKIDQFGFVIQGTKEEVTSEYSITAVENGFAVFFGDTMTSDSQYSIEYSSLILSTTVKEFKNAGKLKANEIEEFTYYNTIENADGTGTAIGDGAMIQIYKQDEHTKEGLFGAEFEVRNSEGKVIAELKTDTNGFAKTNKNLYFGEYTIVEKQAPKGYALDTTKRVVILSKESPQYTTSIIIENSKEVGQIEITKTDESTANPLSGAEFDVKDENGNIVEHVTTGLDGRVTTKEIPLGKYIVVETKAPTGYVRSEVPTQIYLQAHKMCVRIHLSNQKQNATVENKQTNTTETNSPQTENEQQAGNYGNELPETGANSKRNHVTILVILALFLLTMRKLREI